MKLVIPICLLLAITTTLIAQTRTHQETQDAQEGEIFLPAAYTPTSNSCSYTCCVINGVQINVVGTVKTCPAGSVRECTVHDCDGDCSTRPECN